MHTYDVHLSSSVQSWRAVRVIGMERAGDYRRSAALLWTGLVLLSMPLARIVLDCCKCPGPISARCALHVKCDAQTVQRRVSATVVDTTTQPCKLEPPVATRSAHFRITNSAQPLMASRRVGADLPGRDPGIEKVPLKARSEQLRKQAGRWVYSPETSALWPMTCRPTRSRFERRQNGDRTSKRSGWHVGAASSCLNICQMQTKWLTHNVGDASRSNPKLSLWLQ